jgi:hypothetical protein
VRTPIFAVLAAALCGACQTGTGNNTPMAQAAGARTVSKTLQIGFDITNNSYQTPAGYCPYAVGTSTYEQLCWPKEGGGVILVPLEAPWYYEPPPGQRTVVLSWPTK